MRNLLCWLLVFSSFFALSGQPPARVQPDARLFEVYDSAFIFKVLETNPMLVQRWNFDLDHAFVLTDFPPEKGDIAALPSVEIADLARLNILLLEKQKPLARDWERAVFYRVNKSETVLMLLPGKLLMERFRKSLRVAE